MRALVGHHVGVTTEVLLLLLVAFATGLVLTAILCRVGRRLNTMDSSGGAGELKQLRDVPNIGGIAVAWPLIAAIGSMGLLASLAPDFLVDLAPSLADWSDRLAATAPTALALAGSLLILHIIGLIDDRCDLPAVHRLLVQVGIACHIL
jgi:UDP-N-acetylmuramyl pentapeptide phosphotransferase/UDP-N-acetylglucosamine-1-phosphate transferase